MAARDAAAAAAGALSEPSRRAGSRACLIEPFTAAVHDTTLPHDSGSDVLVADCGAVEGTRTIYGRPCRSPAHLEHCAALL